jgi:hypothetical protein
MTRHGQRLGYDDLPARARKRLPYSFRGLALLLSLCLAGCGRIVSTKATDQLIAGDAVDRSVAQIDFRLFSGKKVFLDTQFVNKTVPGVGFVTSEYIVSSIRQKMMCDGCLLQEKTEEADFIIEMRVGALGADGHEIIFGMPPNNYASIAASVSPASSPAAAILPSMPELSVAKKDDQMAAAKVALFAYNRHTREPIWQSGISESRSVVADRWFFGAGPFQKGNVYDPKKQSNSSLFTPDDTESMKPDYFVERRFADPSKSLADTPPSSKTAVAATPAAATPAVAAVAPAKPTTTPAAATPATTPPATAAAPTPAASTPVASTAPAPATTAAATPVANPPAPGPSVPVATPAPTTTANSASPTTAAPGATQTVNAAPVPAAAPTSTATPAATPAQTPANVGSPTAATTAPPPSTAAPNAPKATPAVNSIPNGQPVNGTSPSTGSAADALPDMLSVSLH